MQKQGETWPCFEMPTEHTGSRSWIFWGGWNVCDFVPQTSGTLQILNLIKDLSSRKDKKKTSWKCKFPRGSCCPKPRWTCTSVVIIKTEDFFFFYPSSPPFFRWEFTEWGLEFCVRYKCCLFSRWLCCAFPCPGVIWIAWSQFGIHLCIAL